MGSVLIHGAGVPLWDGGPPETGGRSMTGYEYSTESRTHYFRVDLGETGEEQDEAIWRFAKHLSHLQGVSADFLIPVRRVLEVRYRPSGEVSRCTEGVAR